MVRVSDELHFDPPSYLEMIRSDIPDFDILQSHVAQATTGVSQVRSILDLGTGTGATASAVLGVHPSAHLTGVDESASMLNRAKDLLPEATLVVGRLENPLPGGPFDVIVSALAIHHLDGPGKADLFRRVAASLRSGGRFVFGDVIDPEQPEDAVTPIHGDYDRPSRLSDQLEWLESAGLRPLVIWTSKDLAVIAADRPPEC